MKRSATFLFSSLRKWSFLYLLLFLCDTVYAQSAGENINGNQSFWLWNFLGRLHPLIVHFPVSLLIIAALLELFTIKNFNSKWRPGINVLIYLGTTSAIIAVVFGWLLAAEGDYGEGIVEVHQWLGIGTAVLGIATALLLFFVARKNLVWLKGIYRILLLTTAFAVSIAGHYGAYITHGSDYLSSVSPWNQDDQASEGKEISLAEFASINQKDTISLTHKQTVDLNLKVKEIFAHSCYKCHGSEKVKGDLRLDSKEMIFRGGKSGDAIVPGNPEESELFRRIILPANHKEVMPSKGKRLSESEITVIRTWIQKGAPWPLDSGENKLFRVAALEPRNPTLPVGYDLSLNGVDIWVSEYFKQHNTQWSQLVDDRTYLRRIYLDIIGLLPSPAEVSAFATDKRADKRALKVRELLNRNDDYALHWLTYWNDALRNDYAGAGFMDGGRSAISDWLYTALKTNKPYDQFVKELLDPNKESMGFIKGIKWRGAVNASQRTELQAAQNVSQVFLGLNLKCASCHNSFINNWKLEDAYAFANIFSDSSLEINRCDKPTGKFTGARMLWAELGSIDGSAPVEEKQKQLAVNMIKKENGRLYRTIVNRIWAQFLGRGLVEPLDVMDEEPWSQDLLDWLAFEFVEKYHYDIKELIFAIATSKAYQLPSVGYKDPESMLGEEYKFAGRARKRMSAEQFTDAVSSIIEPLFTDKEVRFRPSLASKRAASGQVSIVRAAVVTNDGFLSALGRPNRENVSTSRESQANLLQALEFTNGAKFNEMLLRGATKWLDNYKSTEIIIKEFYNRSLNRKPTDKELQVSLNILGQSPGKEQIADLFWSVILLPEFQIIY